MRAATALGLSLLIAVHATAQVPPEVSNGPNTTANTTFEQLLAADILGQLRHEDGTGPHPGDFFASGPDCINGVTEQVWHWHDTTFVQDDGSGCGHGAVFFANQVGGGGAVPQLFTPDFLFGEVTPGSAPESDPLAAIERARAEVGTPIGRLDFGRMGSHWGMGIFANDGNRLDFRIADNESPRPQDRVVVIYNHFGDVAGSGTPDGIPTVQPSAFGFERTFLDGDASVGLRAPLLPDLAIDPASGEVVFTTAQAGPNGPAPSLFRSTDGGRSWTPIDLPNGHFPGVHPGSTFDPTGRVLHWTSVRSGLNDFELNIRGVSGGVVNDLGAPNGQTDHGQRFQPNLAVDPMTGKLALGWMDVREGRSTIGFGSYDGQRWGDYSSLDLGLGGNSVDPDFAFDPQGNLYGTFSNNASGNFDPFVFRTQPDGGFTLIPGNGPNGAIVDTPGDGRDPHMTFGPGGRLYVIFTDTAPGRSGSIQGQTYDGTRWHSFDPFSNGPQDYPGGVIPQGTQDFYRFQHPGGGVQFYGIGSDGAFNGSVTLPPPSVRGTRWGDYSAACPLGPDGFAPVPISDGTGAPAANPDEAEYSTRHALNKIADRLAKGLVTPGMNQLREIVAEIHTGVHYGEKSLEDAAKDAVKGAGTLLGGEDGTRAAYDNLQDKARRDAGSSDAHDAARGRQWQRVLDSIGTAAGWPTSTAR